MAKIQEASANVFATDAGAAAFNVLHADCGHPARFKTLRVALDMLELRPNVFLAPSSIELAPAYLEADHPCAYHRHETAEGVAACALARFREAFQNGARGIDITCSPAAKARLAKLRLILEKRNMTGGELTYPSGSGGISSHIREFGNPATGVGSKGHVGADVGESSP